MHKKKIILLCLSFGLFSLFYTQSHVSAFIIDSTPPIISDGLPADNLASGTTTTTLGVTTNEESSCRYSTEAGVDFDTMVNDMATEDFLTHTADLTGLSDGVTYSYYIKCHDVDWNATEDFPITFSVEAPSVTTYTVTGPTSGTVDKESGAFSVTPDGMFTGTITASYSGPGLDGSTTLTFTNTDAPQTFTITPTDTGTVTITYTNSSTLSNPSPSTYRVTGGTRSGSMATSSAFITSTAQTAPVLNTPPAQPKQIIFTKNLTIGMIDPEILLLQQYLNAHGYTVSKEGPGSPGKETTKFGRATKIALIKFQVANHIVPAVGYFGPLTRFFVNNSL